VRRWISRRCEYVRASRQGCDIDCGCAHGRSRISCVLALCAPHALRSAPRVSILLPNPSGDGAGTFDARDPATRVARSGQFAHLAYISSWVRFGINPIDERPVDGKR
jgi:hypothetical protein